MMIKCRPINKAVFLSVFVAAAVFFYFPVWAGNVKFEFVKSVVEAGSAETIGGFIYIKTEENGPADKNSIYFSVTYPVNQIMTFTKKETYVYYPDEKKCLVIVNKDEISNYNFIEPTKSKMDFSALGFKAMPPVKKGKITSQKWAAPAGINSLIKDILLEKDAAGRTVKLELKNKAGKIITRIQYSKYTPVNGREMPLDVMLYTAEGRAGIEERFVLKNPQENVKLPGIINDFKLGNDVKIQRIEMK